MKFLSLQINSDKEVNLSKNTPTNEICEEYEDLYEDEDFLEILNMSSEQIKDEIRSYDEDPDEVLARIKGRLENKIIPLKTKKDNEKIKTENIFNFLFALVNKKITDDAFTKKKKTRTRTRLTNIFKNVFLINTIPTAIIAIFATIIIMESNTVISSTLGKKENIFTTETTNKSNNRFILKYSKEDDSDIMNEERYFSQLIGISPNTIETYAINNEETYKRKTDLAFSDYNNRLFLGNIYKQHEKKDNQAQKKENPIYLTNSSKKQNNIKKTFPLNKEKKKDITKRVYSVTHNNSIFSFKKKYKFKINSVIAVKKLPPLIKGEKVQLTFENNTLIKIGYIKKDRDMLEISLNGDNIKQEGTKKYYIDYILHIRGTVEKGQNIYSMVRTYPLFQEGKNREIANIISDKVGKYMVNKNKPIFFSQIDSGSDFDFSIHVGKDPETKQVASVRHVEDANIRMNFASR